ncbi:uncharacterized protein ARMOST_16170 [Armillaria ostoyae]|uniref:Uncharacterized protein n=1 Tax=Armillaria ostoyae TaxID=47428 RepID=A0A284RVG5_ARMOS|nr:uncharacterized protein ARMOST_16170 [Armillaria ostoyae]
MSENELIWTEPNVGQPGAVPQLFSDGSTTFVVTAAPTLAVRPEQLIRSTLLPALPGQSWAGTLRSHALRNMSSVPLSPTLTDASGTSEADTVDHSHTAGTKRKAVDAHDSGVNTEGRITQKVPSDWFCGFCVRRAHITVVGQFRAIEPARIGTQINRVQPIDADDYGADIVAASELSPA